MNILFLTCWYPTKEAPLKGIFIKEHAAAIKSAGNKVVVLAVNVVNEAAWYKRESEHHTDENGIEVHIIHIRSKLWKLIYINPLLLNSYVKKYYNERIATRFSPSIVHSNILSPAGLLGHMLSTRLGVPHVITEHWSKVGKFMKKNIFSSLGRKAYNEAAAITTVSGFLSKSISPYVNQSSKITVVPNVVDNAIFSFSPKTKKGEIVFTAVATWKAPKQPHLFISGLANTQKISKRKIVLNIVGEGPLLDEVRKQAEQSGLCISFKGNLPKHKIAQMLHESDFFVHASAIETFSLVIAEALSTGTPVIASSVGAIPELITSASGILCENNEESWTDAISNALKREYDHAAISMRYSERFGRMHVGSLFSQLYTKVMNEQGRRG